MTIRSKQRERDSRMIDLVLILTVVLLVSANLLMSTDVIPRGLKTYLGALFG